MTALHQGDVSVEISEKSQCKKNVSFDRDQNETYVYETSPLMSAPTVQKTVIREESLSKVTVISGTSEVPVPINPPSTVSTVGASNVQERASTGIIISPPLPSLEKMEKEPVENPFRPDGELSHVVDPIVEAYKTRPYHDVNGDAADTTPMIQPPSPVLQQEIPVKAKQASNVQSAPEVDGHPLTQTVELQRHNIAPPKAGNVELVHLDEKKRKCGCCVIQ